MIPEEPPQPLKIDKRRLPKYAIPHRAYGTGEWKCPVCPFVAVQARPYTKKTVAALTNIRCNHIRSAHPGVDTSRAPWTQYAPTTAFSSCLTKTQLDNPVWRCPIGKCKAGIPRSDESHCTRPQIQRYKRAHWETAHTSMPWHLFVSAGRQRTCAQNASHRQAAHLTTNAEMVKIMQADSKGHDLKPLTVPRILYDKADKTYRHQFQLAKICTKCGVVLFTLARLRPCGTPAPKPRGKTAGGLAQTITRVKADAKHKGRPPRGHTKDELQAAYRNAIAVLTNALETRKQ